MNNGKYAAANGNKIHMRHQNWPTDKDEYLPTGAATSSKLNIQTDKVTASGDSKAHRGRGVNRDRTSRDYTGLLLRARPRSKQWWIC